MQALETFINDYNFERPHEALNMRTPGDCYTASNRTWNGVLKAPEYDTSIFDVRKVDKGGQIKWKSNHIYISETLIREYVGLRQCEDDNIDVYYGPVFLGKVHQNSLEKPKITTRRPR